MNTTTIHLYGERLYALIAPALDKVSIATIREVGMWTDKISAGRMTGMALEAYTATQLEELLSDPRRIANHMVDCVEVLWRNSNGGSS